MMPFTAIIMKSYISYGCLWWNMRAITTELKIDKSGRIVIPEVYREELKLQSGQLVKITISNPLEGND
jgi:hypothetical protein